MEADPRRHARTSCNETRQRLCDIHHFDMQTIGLRFTLYACRQLFFFNQSTSVVEHEHAHYRDGESASVDQSSETSCASPSLRLSVTLGVTTAHVLVSMGQANNDTQGPHAVRSPCAIANRLGRLHWLAHAAGHGYFLSASTLDHSFNDHLSRKSARIGSTDGVHLL